MLPISSSYWVLHACPDACQLQRNSLPFARFVLGLLWLFSSKMLWATLPWYLLLAPPAQGTHTCK